MKKQFFALPLAFLTLLCIKADATNNNEIRIEHAAPVTLNHFKRVFIDAFMQAYENYNEAELGYTKSKIEYFEELADSEFKDLAGNMGINCSCAYADKELVGWITFAVHNEEAHIRLICASPDQHGKGIGKALITSIIDSFPEIKTITVASNNLNKKAHAFYKKLGFTQTPFPAEHYNPEHYTGFEKNLN